MAEFTNNLGTIEGKKDVLVKDIKTVIGDSEVLLRGMADGAADGYSATRARVEDRLTDAKSRFDNARNEIALRARGLADRGQAYVKDNPWKVVGVTAVVGLAIGYLLRRH